jgi:hypothetical protein
MAVAGDQRCASLLLAILVNVQKDLNNPLRDRAVRTEVAKGGLDAEDNYQST